MKKFILALLVLTLVASIAACGDTGSGSNDTSGSNDNTVATEGKTEPKTEPATTPAPATTVAETEPETAANPPEDLIDYEAIKSSKKDVTTLIDLDSLDWDVDGFNEKEGPASLFDGDTATKYCCSMPPTVTFKLTESKKVTAYAFATANDNDQYGRSPEEFTLYGSTDGKDWKVLDYVQEGSQIIERVNFTYYAFLVDANKQGDYQYYKFEVLEVEGGTTFQVSEFQLFTD